MKKSQKSWRVLYMHEWNDFTRYFPGIIESFLVHSRPHPPMHDPLSNRKWATVNLLNILKCKTHTGKLIQCHVHPGTDMIISHSSFMIRQMHTFNTRLWPCKVQIKLMLHTNTQSIEADDLSFGHFKILDIVIFKTTTTYQIMFQM